MASSEQSDRPNIYAELRPRKSRTKSGCLSCRARRKKCDEQKPICRSCLRLQVKCTWPKDFGKEDSQAETAETAEPTSSGSKTCIQPTADLETEAYGPEDVVPGANDQTKDGLLSELQRLTNDFSSSGIVPYNDDIISHVRNEILHARGPETAMLFDHFCHKTAPWMINGYHYENPVLKFIAPTAAKDELVLYTVMAVSGTHLIHTMPAIESLSTKYYYFALRTLRERLSDWVGKGEENYQPIFTAIILLCHCEFISGNTYGAGLQHLRACHEFVEVALQHLHLPEHQDFVVFLIEHYGFFLLMSNMRCCLRESNIRLGLDFSDRILPLIREYPSFGSIFAFEPQSLALIPRIAQLAWQRNRAVSGYDNPAWWLTYKNLLHSLNDGRQLAAKNVAKNRTSDLQLVISIKINTLLILLHASFYERGGDHSTLMSLLQPLISDTVELLKNVDERDTCYGLYWSVLITGAYIRDVDQQQQVVEKLGSNRSNMSCFSRGIELLQWLWSEDDELNFGLDGLERTAIVRGLEICIC